MYISSDSVKVFPTSKRSDDKDRSSRLFTENNLVGIVNRLTDLDSFVINGLELSASGVEVTITQGSCNIHGYYFNITNMVTYPCNTSDIASKNTLYLRVTTSIFNSPGTNETFETLAISGSTMYVLVSGYTSFTTTSDYIGYYVISNNDYVLVTNSNKDTLSITAGTTETYTIQSNTLDSSGQFNALAIVQDTQNKTVETETTNGAQTCKYYYLPLGTLSYDGTNVSVVKNSHSNLKFDLSSLQVNVNNSDGIIAGNGLTPSDTPVIQNLYEFLNDTLVIDDGNI